MKKIIYGIMLILMNIFSIHSVWAHPLDISSTVITLSNHWISWMTYFHSYEAGILLSKKGYDVSEVSLYNNHKEDIIRYFLEKIEIRNNDTLCRIIDPTIWDQEGYEILSRGLVITYNGECWWNVEKLDVSLDFFTEFPLQTNRLTLLDESGNEVFFKVGTTEIKKLTYTKGVPIIHTDTDHDWLSDEEEKIYKTDPNNNDSDHDYYLDGEEVNYWWNPINAWVGPGQAPREKYENTTYVPPPRNLDQKENKYSLTGNSAIWWLFENLLKRIWLTISGEEKTAFPLLFIITIGLWFLHALGPWHAKGILSWIMVHKKSDFFSGLRFILIFSITHIIDIILLFLLLRVFLHVFNADSVLTWIQKGSAILLLALWIYLMYRAFFLKNSWDEDEKIGNRKITFLAIIAWLTPCTFWWSLFFMLISLWKMSWIPPLIFAIALGIFLCLFLILLILLLWKKYSYKRFSLLSKYSVKLSAILIFIIGFVLTNINFN